MRFAWRCKEFCRQFILRRRRDASRAKTSRLKLTNSRTISRFFVFGFDLRSDDVGSLSEEMYGCRCGSVIPLCLVTSSFKEHKHCGKKITGLIPNVESGARGLMDRRDNKSVLSCESDIFFGTSPGYNLVCKACSESLRKLCHAKRGIGQDGSMRRWRVKAAASALCALGRPLGFSMLPVWSGARLCTK